MKPPCMTWDEYWGWRAMNVDCLNPTLTPCVDCLPGFATQMREQEQCDSHPGKRSLHSSKHADLNKRRAYFRMKATEYRRKAGAKDRAKTTAMRRARIVALRDSGLTVREIAEWLGLVEWTVRRHLRAARDAA